MMRKRYLQVLVSVVVLASATTAAGQTPSSDTYVNPIIPGDHPDPTLTKIGDDFYTSGSSFNPTPKIYHSTDLVHWEVIAQPVSASWNQYGNEPGGGIWGGHMVLHGGTYWHFFGRGGGDMYFVTADQPEGPWSEPTRMSVPSEVPGFGVDNSIFIDDDGSCYLLTKNGRSNNYIVELDDDGQAEGEVYDLTWLNPASEDHPYGWAEGPVMWKHDGYYYYSFAQHLAGDQYVMRSDTLSEDESAWTIMGSLFEDVSNRFQRPFPNPNHSSPAITLDDGTTWIISQAYRGGIGSEWMGKGRQGVLSQITYNEEGKPVAKFPANGAMEAPELPSSGIPWTVPKSDMFDAGTLDPKWSLLGRSPDYLYSLTAREGWLRLQQPPFGQQYNTVIQNDAEHSYSLMTRLDFAPESASEEAGLWVFNGLETLRAKLYSSLNDSAEKAVTFSFDTTSYSVKNTVGSPLWLKMERDDHTLTGFYSADGNEWTQVGAPINVRSMEESQPDFNAFTGNQQGLYVRNKAADFDLYMYRDAYSSIPAEHPANFEGVAWGDEYLGDVQAGDWAMYAGIEFGKEQQPEGGFNYQRTPDSLRIVASSATSGGTVGVWLDSVATGRKIAEGTIENTGGWNSYATFGAAVDSISGRHDVYLTFEGAESEELFRLQSIEFTAKRIPTAPTDIDDRADGDVLPAYSLSQNYPNPFGTGPTHISYRIPQAEHVKLAIYNVVGQNVATLVDGVQSAGSHAVRFDGSDLASGVYFYRLKAGGHTLVKKMVRAR